MGKFSGIFLLESMELNVHFFNLGVYGILHLSSVIFFLAVASVNEGLPSQQVQFLIYLMSPIYLVILLLHEGHKWSKFLQF